jgi:hypothetical protein
VRFEIDFAPRFEYGLTVPIIARDGDVLFARGGATTLVLSTSAELETTDGYTVTGKVELREGEEVGFAVQAISTWGPLTEYWPDRHIRGRIDDTVEAWRDWGRTIRITKDLRRAGGALGPGAASAHLPTDWCDGRRADDLAPRDRGRGEKLGLPILLDT